MVNHPNRSRRVWKDGSSVFLREVDVMGEERIREFWVPPSGGYVREVSSSQPGAAGQQVCKRLAHLGPTLMSSEAGLLDVIRREYRLAVAAERRERAS